MEQGLGPRLASGSGPWFRSVHSRSTSCVVIRFKRRETFALILSLSTRSDTQILRIESKTGELQYQGKEGIDVFPSEGNALDHLSDIETFEVVERGCSLLGYVAIGDVGMLLIALKARCAAMLPGGHQVRLISESRWIQVPLQDYEGPQLTQAELEKIENMQRYTLNNAHYFCETADVSRPFPSRSNPSDPSWEFVWNRWLATSVCNLGLTSHCPHLLQGVVESRVLEDAASAKYMLVLFSRRSRLHPGTRYIARGLNSLASPGNEIECEQLVFTCPQEGTPLRWSNYVWRRGTVPIWWFVELKSGGVGEATINVNARNPYKGTRRYFRRLQRRYIDDLGLSTGREEANGFEGSSPIAALNDAQKAGSAEDDTIRVPVFCINLLRCNMQRRDELLLSEHFSEGVRRVRRSLPGAVLKVLNFDWHGMMKDLKEQPTVEGLWTLLESICPQTDISAGTLEERKKSGDSASTSESSENRTEWGSQWQAVWHSQQRGIVRYNCADSLDRTNAASYFAAVQVLAEQARRLGIVIENKPKAKPSSARVVQAARKPQNLSGALEISTIHQRVRNLMKAKNVDSPLRPAATAVEAGLPEGWEERFDPGTNRKFYIDHINKKTTWDRPHIEKKEDATREEGPDQDIAHVLGGNTLSPTSESRGSADFSESSDTEAQKAKEVSWGLFGLGVNEIRDRLRADVVAAHAEIFLINGDINSNLYTSTRAMHSSIIGLLQGEGSAASKAGVGRLANLGVTLQRRWANVLSDYTRQGVVECFLGLKLKEHFPSIELKSGQQPLPLNESEDDEADLESSMPASLSHKESLPPELVNQASLVSGDPAAAGDSAPAAGELKFAPSANDPGAFVSPAVEANNVTSHHLSSSHPLL